MRATSQSPTLDELELFDSCVSLGEFVLSSCRENVTVVNVHAVMDRYHVKEALVHDHHARINYPRERGNERLLREVADSPRLHPVFVVDPDYLAGHGSPGELVEAMFEKGVKGARLPMRAFPPLPWLWRELCVELEKRRVPCFLDFGDVSTRGDMSERDVDGVRSIALAHPELPLILSHVMGGLGIHSAVLPMMKQVGNVFIDGLGILEFWRRAALEIGPERVLFATGMPFADPGVLASDIQYAVDFSIDEKKQMAGGNLRKMMERVK